MLLSICSVFVRTGFRCGTLTSGINEEVGFLNSDYKMIILYRCSVVIVVLAVSLIAAIMDEYFIALSASIALGFIIHRLMDEVEFDNRPPFPEVVHRGPCHIRFNDEMYPEWLQVCSGECFLYDGVDFTGGFPTRMIEGGLVYSGIIYKITTKSFSSVENKTSKNFN